MLNPQAWMMPPWTRSVPPELKESAELKDAHTLWVWENNLEDMRSDGPFPNERKVLNKLMDEVYEYLNES